MRGGAGACLDVTLKLQVSRCCYLGRVRVRCDRRVPRLMRWQEYVGVLVDCKVDATMLRCGAMRQRSEWCLKAQAFPVSALFASKRASMEKFGSCHRSYMPLRCRHGSAHEQRNRDGPLLVSLLARLTACALGSGATVQVAHLEGDCE